MRFLEQQNKVLETKWHLLQQQGLSDRPQGLESFFEAYLVQLRTQLERLQRERGPLDAELKSCQGQEEEYKAKYVNHSIPMGPGWQLGGLESGCLLEVVLPLSSWSHRTGLPSGLSAFALSLILRGPHLLQVRGPPAPDTQDWRASILAGPDYEGRVSGQGGEGLI